MSEVILECRDVCKRYDDGSRVLEVLSSVSLEIVEGEVFALTGPSGAGKSTLLHCMGTLDVPSSGDVYFRGQSLRSMYRKTINRIRNEEIGFVFQFYHLLPEFTALENVMMPALCKGGKRGAYRERAEEILHKVGLKERLTHKPGQLSGGEQQRVAIARALFNEPSVVLCDEPTGNLDESTGASVAELLLNLNTIANTTLVIVTHDDRLAEQATRWAVLHDGRAEMRKG